MLCQIVFNTFKDTHRYVKSIHTMTFKRVLRVLTRACIGGVILRQNNVSMPCRPSAETKMRLFRCADPIGAKLNCAHRNWRTTQ